MDDNRDLREGIAGAIDQAGELAGKTQSASAAVFSTVQDAAKEAGTRVADLATESYRRGTKAGEYLSRNTAEQPLMALLLAATVGYAIAYLIHRRWT